MRQELKRIEATLHQLADQSCHKSSPEPKADTSDSTLSGKAEGQSNAFSRHASDQPNAAQAEMLILQDYALSEAQIPPTIDASPGGVSSPGAIPNTSPKRAFVEPFPIELADARTPALPKLKSPTFTTHRNAANPALAINLLKEIQAIVLGWQEELQQVLRQIQDLYLEGPIVDGWLESYAHGEAGKPEPQQDVDCLLDYVEKLRESLPMQPPSNPASPAREIATGYRLCGLNEDGQLWFRHCPAHQVPAIGLAIARYQRLRQHLTRKQYLETRLSQLTEMLIALHGQMSA